MIHQEVVPSYWPFGFAFHSVADIEAAVLSKNLYAEIDIKYQKEPPGMVSKAATIRVFKEVMGRVVDVSDEFIPANQVIQPWRCHHLD